MDKELKQKLYQLGLFILTFISTTLSGAEFIYGWLFLYVPNSLGWSAFVAGLQYSIPFLLILSAHEFGHYFTARYHKINVSLPYFFPAWLGFIGSMSLGTFGAFIRIRQRISSISHTFDVGIAGPLAGFIVALAVLFYGFTHLPEKEYIYHIHPEYQLFGDTYKEIVYTKDTFFLKENLAKISPDYAKRFKTDTIFINQNSDVSFQLGSSILFDYMKNNWVPREDKDRLPNNREIMHYPFILAGFFALMFTALNLLPIGQLDGGHIIFGMFGAKTHTYVSKIFYSIAILYAGIGVGFLEVINPFIFNKPISRLSIDLLLYLGIIYFLLRHVFEKKQTRLIYALGIYVLQIIILYIWPNTVGYSGWFLFILIVGRFIRVQHPLTTQNKPLTTERIVLGWIAIIIFIISFSLKPIIIG